ncbi:MAG: hypothetical protein KAV01_12675 [Candidatus Lokiarchaeota archaeon]|nr:hypothetical protein [Candidatus Lokiarchaeota archaeon]
MTEELNGEEKEGKSDKETVRVDKEFLSKAKNSRDMIDKELRKFENSIEDISETITNGETVEEKEIDKKAMEKISEETKEAQMKLNDIQKKIDDKEEYLTAIEETIKQLEEKYNRNTEELTNLDERLAITKESKENLEEEYMELLKNNEQLVKAYESRQVDLIVLTDSIKEKIANQDDLRNKIAKWNQGIQEKEDILNKQREDSETLEKKLKSQRAENDTLKVSILKNKIELEHSNSEIEAKEEEKNLLNEQIEKKEKRIKEIEINLEEYKEGFPEMEKQRATYEELLAKYKIQLSDKQQQMIEIESRIQGLNDTTNSMIEQIITKENLIEANEKRLVELKQDIETSNTEYIEREQRLTSLNEKLQRAEADHEKLSKAKEAIENSTNDSRVILQRLKVELENQEKEIRDKESRIHRLEVLSAIYRASKFFGGILIGMGIFFVIYAMGVFYNFIDLGDLSVYLMGLFLLIGAILAIISGIFHLEKS